MAASPREVRTSVSATQASDMHYVGRPERSADRERGFGAAGLVRLREKVAGSIAAGGRLGQALYSEAQEKIDAKLLLARVRRNSPSLYCAHGLRRH